MSIFGPLLHLAVMDGYHHVRSLHTIGYHTDHIISLPIIGIVLLYLATFVYRRRLLAVYIGGVLSSLLVVYEWTTIVRAPIVIITALLTLLFIVTCVFAYRQFTIRNNFEGIGRHLRPVVIVMLVGIVYGVGGFMLFGDHFVHMHLTPKEAVDLTIDSMTGFSSTAVTPTRAGRIFIDSLSGVGIVIFILLVEALFRPLGLKVLATQQHDQDLAQRILEESSGSSEDFFKLWPHDKRYFFATDRTAFIAYAQSGRTIVVLGGPAGNPRAWPQLTTQFSEYCRSLGWIVAVINADKRTRSLYRQHGLISFSIGNEAVVDVAAFAESTVRDKHFRYVANRARRDELTIEEWSTIDGTQIDSLRKISNEWLSRGRREYTFFMGYFNESYLRQGRVFVVLQAGNPVGYVNIIPSFSPEAASIDMFRSVMKSSPVTIHFLLMNVLRQLHDEQVATLNLGLSPLSGVSEDQDAVSRALLRSIRFLGASYYAFQGLEQFKNKFRPTWERRWLLVSGVPTNVIQASRDIERVSRYEPYGNWRVYSATLAGVGVVTMGLYFILGQ